MTDTVVILTSGSSWTVPADFNPAANTIEAIGGGAAGGATVGGAGADYAKVSNQSLSGSIAIAIGAAGTSGGNGGDTTFGSILLAKGGGSASTDIGTVTYAGGTTTSAGGGGAAGPSGAGGNASGNTGGTGDNGTVAADTGGTEWGTAGSGGGGSFAGSGFTDNFATPASASNWTMSLQGTAGGAYAFNTGNMTMTPAASQKNSVAMRRTGPFTAVAATIARAANPNTLDYTTLALGTGNITTYNNDNSSWQITTIQYGYSLVIRAPGNMTLYLDDGSGTSATLGTKTYTDSTPNDPHTYTLTANGSGVVVKRDGVTMMTSSNTTYPSGGDILIAQGEYTSGNGAIDTLTQVTAS